MGFFGFLRRKSESRLAPAPNIVSAIPIPRPATIFRPPIEKSETQPIPDSLRGTTTIERPEYIVHLPFKWKEVPSAEPGHSEFRCELPPDQLMITIRGLRDGADLRQAVEGIANTFADVFGEMTNHAQSLSKPDLRTGNGQVEIRMFGRDPEKEVQMAVCVRGDATKVISFAYYRYSLRKLGMPFEAEVGMVFDFIQLR